MDKYKVAPQEFKGAIQRLSKATYKTSYVPKKVTDALRKSGASRGYFQSTPKAKFLRTIGDMQAQGVLKTKKELAPKRLYEDIVDDRDSVNVGSHVSLASEKLPLSMPARDFVRFYEQATGKRDARTVLQSLGMPTGSQQARPGKEERLTKQQMLLVLNRLRSEGKLTASGIGDKIRRSIHMKQIYVQEGIASEEMDRLQRYSAAAVENLPEGVQRAIGRPAPGSALGRAERTTSVARADQGSVAEEAHATTGSALSRRAKPNEPTPSAARQSKTTGFRKPPELPDLPIAA